jgi:hypothetical protein
MTVAPDDEIIVISVGGKGPSVAHTRECLSVTNAADEKIRRVKRKQHPNVRLCKHCTDPVDKSSLDQSTLASDIRGLWAND